METVHIQTEKSYVLHILENDYVSDRIKQEKQFYEIEQLLFQKGLNLEPGIWVDGGAHIGTHSLFYKLECKASKVYAFEPNPVLADICIENFRINHLENDITLFDFGLWDFACSKNLYTHYENNSGSNSIFKQVEDAELVGEILMTTLDHVFIFEQLEENDKIVFIKLDIEGAESHALLGGIKTIEKHMPVIYCECHTSYHLENCLSILSRYNYRIQIRGGEHCYFFPPGYAN